MRETGFVGRHPCLHTRDCTEPGVIIPENKEEIEADEGTDF